MGGDATSELKGVKGSEMKVKKKVSEVEVKAESLDVAVAMIKKATAGTKPVSFEICAYYEEDED